MGIPTPLYPRTSACCKSMRWKEWSGYWAAERYDISHESEYFAIRETAALLDVSPLYKYDILGPDAEALVNRIVARDVTRLKDGQVAYCCWCDEQGKVIDDGTLFRFSAHHWRISSADPSYRWLALNGSRLNVEIRDCSTDQAVMALQGPRSALLLADACSCDLQQLGFFRFTEAKIGTTTVHISRTGYTGDLGYEVWAPAEQACQVWDVLMEAGVDHGLAPAGLLALDMARVEAGFVLIDVDYRSALHAITPSQRSSPYEIGLGWTVHLDKAPFIGQKALCQEKKSGSPRSLVGLQIDIQEMERLYDSLGLPVALPSNAWRSVVPLYAPRIRRQIGWATSGVWSPLLKQNLALATVETAYAPLGSEMLIEVMVDYDRKLVPARVVPKPFFDPPRKKAKVVLPALATAGSN